MTTYKSPAAFELAAGELRALGIVLTRLPGEYRVNYRNGGDGTARLAEDTSRRSSLAARSLPPRRRRPWRRGRRPLRMTTKAVRRRKIKAHNYRLRARALKKQRDES
jgi:hypothetical protein